MEKILTSDYSAARAHLERAIHYLRGEDDTSRNSREALELIVEAVIVADMRRPSAKVIKFRGARSAPPHRRTQRT